MELICILPSSNEALSWISDSSVQRPASNISRSSKPGKGNPFMPLTIKRNVKSPTNKVSDADRTTQAKPELFPVIRLTATFIAIDSQKHKPTAIIEENGKSRFVSIGDIIAGMTVVKIQRGKVILSKGDKKCVMKLGLLSEETAANRS